MCIIHYFHRPVKYYFVTVAIFLVILDSQHRVIRAVFRVFLDGVLVYVYYCFHIFAPWFPLLDKPIISYRQKSQAP